MEGKPQQLLLVWDSEVITTGDGQAKVIARRPLSRMSVAQAAKLLGCSEWTVNKLHRLGALTGWKPGAAVKRSDGRASNAKLVLDAESVLRHKAKSAGREV